MSEEIKKEAQDTELNPEELGGVAGGLIVDSGNVFDHRMIKDEALAPVRVTIDNRTEMALQDTP